MSELATFAGGCFWGVEHLFAHLPGVLRAESGYMGGTTANPSYQDICTGATGHAEVVQVEFDPERVSYEELVEVFWELHDPTTLNRQGPDVGTQYRSAIFCHSEAQRAAAEASKARAQGYPDFAGKTIVTEITPAATFYRAEEYHQKYIERTGRPSCHIRHRRRP